MNQKLNTDDLFNKIIQQEKDAFQFGFYWENYEQLIEQIKSECIEIKEAIENQNRINLKEEVGDLINATISLCIFLQLDPHETLNNSIKKFQKRFDILVNIVKKNGLSNLKNQSIEELLFFWHEAKKIVKESSNSGS